MKNYGFFMVMILLLNQSCFSLRNNRPPYSLDYLVYKNYKENEINIDFSKMTVSNEEQFESFFAEESYTLKKDSVFIQLPSKIIYYGENDEILNIYIISKSLKDWGKQYLGYVDVDKNKGYNPDLITSRYHSFVVFNVINNTIKSSFIIYKDSWSASMGSEKRIVTHKNGNLYQLYVEGISDSADRRGNFDYYAYCQFIINEEGYIVPLAHPMNGGDN